MRWFLAVSVLSACLLTFVWPFAVSGQPNDPLFRVLATGTFITLLGSIAALGFCRLRGSA